MIGTDQAQPLSGGGREVNGFAVLLQDARARLTTAQGSLWWAAQTTDVRQLLNAARSQRDLDELGARLTSLFDGDPRAEYVVTARHVGRELVITVTISANGISYVAELNTATGDWEVRSA